MFYSREYLNFVHKSFEESQAVVQTLVNALANDQELTLSEARYVGNFLSRAQTDTDEGHELLTRLYAKLPTYRFWTLYLQYLEDINGEGLIVDAFGPISTLQKVSDLAFLDDQYRTWKLVLYNLKNKKTTLQYLTKESRDDIAEALAYSKQIGDGSRRRNAIERTLVLHSKYVYQKIEEYYQEYDSNQDIIQFCGQELVVDGFAYAHIAIRHMAVYSKFGRLGKTFITDRYIDIEHLPRVLINLLKIYENHIGCNWFDGQRIFLRLNGRNYVVRFKSFERQLKGGGTINYLRLQTCYPAELRNDAVLVSQMNLEMASEHLGFYR